MLRDLGSRDPGFIGVVRKIRSELLSLCGPGAGEYEAVPMQGSGTFAIEAVLSSAIPVRGKLLLLINGAYGRRMLQIAVTHDLSTARRSNSARTRGFFRRGSRTRLRRAPRSLMLPWCIAKPRPEF